MVQRGQPKKGRVVCCPYPEFPYIPSQSGLFCSKCFLILCWAFRDAHEDLCFIKVTTLWSDQLWFSRVSGRDVVFKTTRCLILYPEMAGFEPGTFRMQSGCPATKPSHTCRPFSFCARSEQEINEGKMTQVARMT